MRRILARLFRDPRGGALIEFAFAVPILLFVVLATVDVSRRVLLDQKLLNAAAGLADLASRDETLSLAQLDDLVLAVDHITAPFAFSEHGRVIVTGVGAEIDNDPRILWQYVSGTALAEPSGIGSVVGGPADLGVALTVRANETVIVAEIFFAYVPIFDSVLDARTLRAVGYFRPRLGILRSLN